MSIYTEFTKRARVSVVKAGYSALAGHIMDLMGAPRHEKAVKALADNLRCYAWFNVAAMQHMPSPADSDKHREFMEISHEIDALNAKIHRFLAAADSGVLAPANIRDRLLLAAQKKATEAAASAPRAWRAFR